MEEIPSDLFGEWKAFDQLEPIGGIRDDIHAAQICQRIMSSVGIKTTLGDHILDLDNPEETKNGQQTTQQAGAVILASVREAQVKYAGKRPSARLR